MSLETLETRRFDERRIFDYGPPAGFSERRCNRNPRSMTISEAPYEAFETLMTALGFREQPTYDQGPVSSFSRF